MEWADWQLVRAVAREGSLTDAGRALLLDQSTVSRRLSALEEQLGRPLFLRSRRGVQPTPSCQRLLPLLERAAGALDEAARIVSWTEEPAAGTVRLSSLEAVANFMLVPALPPLLRAHPGLEVEIQPSEALSDLQARESDIGLRLMPPGDADLVARAVDSGPLRPFASPQLLPSCAASLEVTDVPWVGWAHSRANLPEYRLLESLRAPVAFRSPRATTMVQAALSGVGAILLPERFGARIEGLSPLPMRGLPSPQVTLYLVTPRGLRDEPVVDLVWRWLLSLFELG